MKMTLKNVSVVLLITLSSSFGFAKTTWVKSLFWEAPQATEINVQVKSVDAQLLDDCKNLKKTIFAADGTLNFDRPERVDDIRKYPFEDSMDNDFSTTFIFQDSIQQIVDVAGSSEALTKTHESYLPYAVQTKAETAAESLTAFKVSALPGSFSDVTQKLGLKTLPIVSVLYKGQQALKISGRDLACDLLQGKATIEAKASSTVKIPIDNQIQLMNYYKEIEAKVLQVRNLPDSDTIKAARLGFRLGQFFTTDKPAERFIAGVMGVLFQKNSFELSSAWTSFNGEPSIQVIGAVKGEPMTVQIGKKD